MITVTELSSVGCVTGISLVYQNGGMNILLSRSSIITVR